MNEERLEAYRNLINALLNCNEGEKWQLLQAHSELLDAHFLQIMQKAAEELKEKGDQKEADLLRNIADKLIYQHIIAQLLNCTSKEEASQILDANRDWVDEGLQQTMLEVAEDLRIQGYLDKSNFLMNLAGQLMGLYGNTSDAKRKFLLQVLQTIAKSNSNPEIVYPLLQKNLDKLDEDLGQILESWAKETLSSVNFALACYRATVILNFSDLILRFPLGNIAANKEISIIGYQIALNIFTFEAFPNQWASIHHNLAAAYSKRIRGERAENLEKAIALYQQALKVRTYEAFPEDWARTQHNLALAYAGRIRGERADNLERAITYYREALKILTYEAYPSEWSNIHNSLALAYAGRIRGEQAENLEKAIALYQKALKVRTYEAFPKAWADTQNSLALAYAGRIREERAENLEKAIALYQKALKVRTYEAFPEDWADTQNNFGESYRKRIRGERAENLEKAITLYQEALKVYTFDAFPEDWAMMQNNLALAYAERIRGVQADNLERAIAYYQKALKVYTFDAFPYEWARTQHNLALAYRSRIRGKQADNLERAIAYYQKALKVYTFDVFPKDWAMTQNNLAVAYLYRIREEQADNLEKAIAACQEALKVYTYDAYPYRWADTHNNLAAAYSKRIRGEQADNLEKAIASYQKVLKVYTYDAYPYGWAGTNHNLAYSYRSRIRGERADNLERAIASYENALKIRTRDSNPFECLLSARELGNLHYTESNWKTAIEAYHRAIEALETYRLEALNPQSRQEILSEAIAVYYTTVQSYLNLNQPDRALEYVERSKTRELIELLANREIYPKGVSEAVKTELDRLRRAIANEGHRLAIVERNRNNLSTMLTSDQNEQPFVIDYSYFNQLRQQLDEFIEGEINLIDPNFILTQEVKPISFSDIQSLIDKRTAIIEWYITGEKILAFIVTRQSLHSRVWQSSNEDLKNLINWVNEYLKTYYTNQQQWGIELESRLRNLTKILHLEKILLHVISECDRLIFIPHSVLHILPLHALSTGSLNSSSECLLDLFPRGVQYAPSCQLLKLAQSQQRPDFSSLFAIQNPTEDLIYTDLEVETIRSFFPDAEVLAKQAANEASLKLNPNLSLANCVHFSCHGTFNFASPLESALVLSPDEANTEDGYLTLAEIFELFLQKCRLVTLSACETGLTDFSSFSDEYIGLPSGFLYAGSPAVVGSLWTVNDISTAFLMIKFYENLRKHMSLAVALNQAQLWLRDANKEEILDWTKLNDDFKKEFQQQVEEELELYNLDEKIFSSPFHWAAFCAIGQ